ncbi:CHAT domain-containing protein [Nostoc ellipsosporum NOK]|nr:CHAT domain-containing protein [Nostoc ellipsosporum NOK]
MNEQRLQAYYQLIESLLNCPDGEEPEILAANTELLDAGFLQVLAAVADHFAQQGEENTANWLRNLATYLTSETPPITEEDIKTYGQFLVEILQATAENNGDAQVIYPLLAANTDKLNDIFAELLRRWATNTLAEAKPDAAADIVLVIAKFSNRISDFPLGSKANKIEIAITGYEIALTVYTRSAFPEQWGSMQNNLGLAYRNRILGERAENLEEAIAAFTAALEVRTRNAFPEQWAMTQNNLATVYSDRILGERANNIEMAIAASSAALEVYTRSAFPEKWAGTQNNLGNAYSDRILGEQTENIELAIAAFSSALEVYTRSAFPEDWAGTQNNLGEAYRKRILGERAENIELAITAFSAALQVLTKSAFPENWATTQNNLGLAYSERILGERAKNIELAIAAFSSAIEVYTRSAFSENWATVQNNLGAAYRNRIIGERAENIELAIAAFSSALEVTTRSAFPQYHAETLLNLGRLYQDEQQFDLAYNTFIAAIETVEALRGDIVSGEEAKRKQAEEWNQLYRRMVEVCLVLARDTQAIEYIERSKTRNLVELLTKATSTSPEDLSLVNHSIQFEEIQNLLDNETAIIQWYIFNNCFRAFIITHENNKPAIWHSSKQDLDALIDWTNGYLQVYREDKKRWRYELSNQLSQLSQILHLNQIISLVPSHCQKLILIPHLYLHLSPLHALPLSASNSPAPEYLIDKFPKGVSYAPSCQLLRFAQIKTQNLDISPLPLSHLFAIQNPTNDLTFTDIEVETIAADFQPHQILKHNQATKAALAESPINENLRNAQWLHFSCHGYFNFNSPLKSGLQLADAQIPANTASSRYLQVDKETSIDLNQCLTLEDIFLLNLPNCRLVCLSACETGLIDITNYSDEYIGLASGFIHAGAANIISSLWAVSDFHTSLLMIKFYEILISNPDNITLALNTAQQWLRQATQAQIVAWIEKKKNIETAQKQKIIEVLLQEYKPDQQPFKRPEF